MADGRLTLGGDEGHEVVDGIDGAGAVLDLPDDHGRHFNGVAVGIVDLDRRTLLIADPHRHRATLGEGVHPP